jgi:NAD(P)-dependent dehydrogenase (short-subunit alcohol dehydrogenase family)
MNKISIVTGGGSGIGQAIAVKLASTGRQVLICGRRQQKLESTRSVHPDKISILEADVSDVNGRSKIVSFVANNSVEFLVHNAAVLGEIGYIGELDLEDWRKTMAINVEGPLFLTQALLSKMNKTRILHISSGAANHPVSGWSAYCTSKAALYMLFLMQNEELRDKGILTGSLRPGIVNTEMQDLIRQADVKKHKNLQRFHDLYNNGELESSERVAKMVLWMLTQASDEQFIKKEYDLRHDDSTQLWDK